jgi:hypothetical protein
MADGSTFRTRLPQVNTQMSGGRMPNELGLRELQSIFRDAMKLAGRFEYGRLQQRDLERRTRAAAERRDRRRQEWHLRRRGFRPCLRQPRCDYWFRGRSDRRYCSQACRQAAYRERHCELTEVRHSSGTL